MESWIAWLVLAALLGLAEIMTTTLAFGLLAVAAVVAAVVGAAGFGLPFQLVAFVLGAGAGLGIVRPLAEQPNFVVRILNPQGTEIGSVWFGPDPYKKWAHDGHSPTRQEEKAIVAKVRTTPRQ